MLQNRVAPDGTLHANKSRGMFTGNRGVIHDPETRALTGRRWTTPAWICCSLQWHGRRRNVWGRNYLRRDGTWGAGWTELFFLDEITALAAGHRPCHTCRNADAKRFHAAFCEANGQHDATGKNRILHNERWHSSRTDPVMVPPGELRDLPAGTVIRVAGRFLVSHHDGFLVWGFDGYGARMRTDQFSVEPVALVTPPSIVRALRAGYQPAWHASAT